MLIYLLIGAVLAFILLTITSKALQNEPGFIIMAAFGIMLFFWPIILLDWVVGWFGFNIIPDIHLDK